MGGVECRPATEHSGKNRPPAREKKTKRETANAHWGTGLGQARAFRRVACQAPGLVLIQVMIYEETVPRVLAKTAMAPRIYLGATRSKSSASPARSSAAGAARATGHISAEHYKHPQTWVQKC